VGAAVFDDRFGLAGRRPRELVRMPFLANDRLDPAQSHGDLLLALSADQPDMLLHALRQLMRRTRDNLVLHWMLDGYNRPTPGPSRDGPATATCSASRTARPTSTSTTSG
jgi:deferrochelatase/peroxidase EfeB